MAGLRQVRYGALVVAVVAALLGAATGPASAQEINFLQNIFWQGSGTSQPSPLDTVQLPAATAGQAFSADGLAAFFTGNRGTASLTTPLSFSLYQAPSWLRTVSDCGTLRGKGFPPTYFGTCGVEGTVPAGTTRFTFRLLARVISTGQTGVSPTWSVAVTTPQAPPTPVLSPAAAPLTAKYTSTYQYRFGVTGTTAAPAYALVSGPDWLSMNPTTGLLAGNMPPFTRTFTYTVRAVAGGVATVAHSYTVASEGSLVPPGIVTMPAAVATPGVAYASSLVAANNDYGPYRLDTTGLPPGITVENPVFNYFSSSRPTFRLSGTPTVAGTTQACFTVTSAAGLTTQQCQAMTVGRTVRAASVAPGTSSSSLRTAAPVAAAVVVLGGGLALLRRRRAARG